MIYAGIDPGKSGAIAFFNDKTFLCVFKLPFIGDELDIRGIKYLFKSVIEKHKESIIAILEKVHSRPGQSCVAMFTFGKQYGEIRGLLKSMNMSFIEPTPQAWKKLVLAGMDWKGNKEASCHYVMKKFPTVQLLFGRSKKPHDGIADAICIAEYGKMSNKSS